MNQFSFLAEMFSLNSVLTDKRMFVFYVVGCISPLDNVTPVSSCLDIGGDGLYLAGEVSRP